MPEDILIDGEEVVLPMHVSLQLRVVEEELRKMNRDWYGNYIPERLRLMFKLPPNGG